MKKVYITVAGMAHYHGQAFLKPGMKIRLIKEPDNEHDREAIRAELEGLGKIGYVANSPYTVLGESMSAGRLYDRVGDTAKAKVKYVTAKGAVCAVREKDLMYSPPLTASPREDDWDELKF